MRFYPIMMCPFILPQMIYEGRDLGLVDHAKHEIKLYILVCTWASTNLVAYFRKILSCWTSIKSLSIFVSLNSSSIMVSINSPQIQIHE